MLLKALRRLDMPRADDLARSHVYHLVIAYVLISLPMALIFPLWLSAIAAAATGLKVWSIHRRHVISTWWTLPILLLAGALIVVNYDAFGREYVAIASLFVLASLKLLEARNQRDAFLLMLIYMLLIMGSLMTSSSPLALLYLVIGFLYNIYIQMRIALPADLPISGASQWRTIGKVMLVASPFVIALFFLFPRIDPMWMQQGAPQSRTGFSESMTPDSLSSLALDGGLAFRVKFEDGKIPPVDTLYWRGPVLSEFDGQTWRQSSEDNSTPHRIYRDSQEDISYTITHTGQTKDWVMPLDLPVSYARDTRMNGAFAMQTNTPINQPRAFSLSSNQDAYISDKTELQIIKNLGVRDPSFPQTQALAATLAEELERNHGDVSPVLFADRLMEYFQEGNFRYDLAPPVGNADLDRFLFENKAGYCEHYASAFAYMMRSQSIPARVVVGYQGGEINPFSNEVEVKHLNAHAWVEIYSPARSSWERYDPTSAISPNRVSQGTPFGNAANANQAALGNRLENQSPLMQSLLSRLRAMDAFWENWIINFDRDKQRSLWARLGLSEIAEIAWLLAIIGLLPIVLLLVWWYRRRQQRQFGDEIHQIMHRFENHLTHLGYPRPASQPLREFVEGIDEQYITWKEDAQSIADQYYNCRYARSSANAQQLNQLVKTFIKRFRQNEWT